MAVKRAVIDKIWDQDVMEKRIHPHHEKRIKQTHHLGFDFFVLKPDTEWWVHMHDIEDDTLLSDGRLNLIRRTVEREAILSVFKIKKSPHEYGQRNDTRWSMEKQ